MSQIQGDLLGALSLFQQLARTEVLSQERQDAVDERKRVDVTGRWKGFNSAGQGKVEYKGRIYLCDVLSYSCKQKDALVNLRRTPLGNFVDWQ